MILLLEEDHSLYTPKLHFLTFTQSLRVRAIESSSQMSCRKKWTNSQVNTCETPNQSGFRKIHSTDSWLTFLHDKILKGFDKGLMTGMILIDLQKAFDTIDHDTLLKKLSAIGFSNHTIGWFKSYLPNRFFRVNLGTCYSDPCNITCGIPRGSILGPLLFLIYVNDMPQTAKSNLFLYTDDSCLIFQGKDVIEIKKQLKGDFTNICEWFVDNSLAFTLVRIRLNLYFCF